MLKEEVGLIPKLEVSDGVFLQTPELIETKAEIGTSESNVAIMCGQTAISQPKKKKMLKKVECKICGKVLNRMHSYNRHMMTIHSDEKPFSCNICSKPFKHPEQVKHHMSVHTNAVPYKCNVCEKSFKTQIGLKIHNTVHMDSNSTFNCEFCNKAFCYSSLMKQHIDKVHNKIFKCPTCNEIFPSSYKFEMHKRMHRGIPINKFTCTICERRFQYHNHLRKHLLAHEGKGKKFMCDICGKTVTSKSSLQDHKLLHVGVKSLQCNDCGKMFLNLKNLRFHARIHTGEKPYSCDVCNKKYTQRSTLVIHMRSHTGERPYKCDLCDAEFVSRCALNAHKKHKHKLM